MMNRRIPIDEWAYAKFGKIKRYTENFTALKVLQFRLDVSAYNFAEINSME